MHFLLHRCTRPQRSPRLRSLPSSSSLELLSLRLCRPSLASFPSLPSLQRPGAPFLHSPATRASQHHTSSSAQPVSSRTFSYPPRQYSSTLLRSALRFRRLQLLAVLSWQLLFLPRSSTRSMRTLGAWAGLRFLRA